MALNLDDLSDDELAATAAVGDSDAFAALVNRTLPPLLRYLQRMVNDPQTAEDLAQDILINCWKNLADFEFQSSFRTWMFAIAHRKTIDYYRRRRDVPIDDEQFRELASPQPLPVDAALNATLVDALRTELGNLPRLSRAAWWLREVEGLSHEEISQVLRISRGSLRGHLQRSRHYLSTRLQPWHPSSRADAAAPESAQGHIGSVSNSLTQPVPRPEKEGGI